MFGLGKKRSKFGRFIDANGVSQEDVRKASGLNKDTLSRICNEDDVKTRGITRKALVDAVRKLTGKDVKSGDFWTL